MADLVCIDPNLVSKVWPFTKALIKSAIDRTGLSDFGELEAAVLRGDQLLWIACQGSSIEASATTHLIKIDGKKVCILTACGGYHRERWLPLFSHIQQYAKNEGCSTFRIYGRKGWERVLDGFRVEHVILEKEL